MKNMQLIEIMRWIAQQGGDLFALGGPVMWPLLLVSLWLWTLVIERYWFLLYQLPTLLAEQKLMAQKAKLKPVQQTEMYLAIRRYLNLIKTLAGILPMLGLLGTVVGIVETFDLIRIFGSAETQIVARGVSQALITTLAGLVLGLFGLAVSHDLGQRAQICERWLGSRSMGL